MKSKWILMAALTAALSIGLPSVAQTPASPSAKQTSKTREKKATKATKPTSQEITDARTKGMVWVNTKTKVYHQADSRLYGRSKHGEFMTQDAATKAGYRAAKNKSATKSAKKISQFGNEVNQRVKRDRI
jgi:hypothetical protein